MVITVCDCRTANVEMGNLLDRIVRPITTIEVLCISTLGVVTRDIGMETISLINTMQMDSMSTIPT
jgi:hypothetical protein